MRTDDEKQRLFRELLAQGVPWSLALEAIASTAIDKDSRVQTHSLRDVADELDNHGQRPKSD